MKIIETVWYDDPAWKIDEPGFQHGYYLSRDLACDDLARLRMVRLVKEVGGEITV